MPIGGLHPTGIPTTIHIGKPIHMVSTCPLCNLSFHCNNWVPSPCGHTYHRHCIVGKLQESCTLVSMVNPSCLACKQLFHPDWLACKQLFHPDWLMSWGFKANHSEVVQIESTLNSTVNRQESFGNLFNYYTDQALIAAKVFNDVEKTVLEPPLS